MKVDFQGVFGAKLFDDRKMNERLSAHAYETLCKVRDEAMIWDPSVADEVADAINVEDKTIKVKFSKDGVLVNRRAPPLP